MRNTENPSGRNLVLSTILTLALSACNRDMVLPEAPPVGPAVPTPVEAFTQSSLNAVGCDRVGEYDDLSNRIAVYTSDFDSKFGISDSDCGCGEIKCATRRVIRAPNTGLEVDVVATVKGDRVVAVFDGLGFGDERAFAFEANGKTPDLAQFAYWCGLKAGSDNSCNTMTVSEINASREELGGNWTVTSASLSN